MSRFDSIDFANLLPNLKLPVPRLGCGASNSSSCKRLCNKGIVIFHVTWNVKAVALPTTWPPALKACNEVSTPCILRSLHKGWNYGPMRDQPWYPFSLKWRPCFGFQQIKNNFNSLHQTTMISYFPYVRALCLHQRVLKLLLHFLYVFSQDFWIHWTGSNQSLIHQHYSHGNLHL
jgi:hypothetical protein